MRRVIVARLRLDCCLIQIHADFGMATAWQSRFDDELRVERAARSAMAVEDEALARSFEQVIVMRCDCYCCVIAVRL